jgi:hypothetical protein
VYFSYELKNTSDRPITINQLLVTWQALVFDNDNHGDEDKYLLHSPKTGSYGLQLVIPPDTTHQVLDNYWAGPYLAHKLNLYASQHRNRDEDQHELHLPALTVKITAVDMRGRASTGAMSISLREHPNRRNQRIRINNTPHKRK